MMMYGEQFSSERQELEDRGKRERDRDRKREREQSGRRRKRTESRTEREREREKVREKEKPPLWLIAAKCNSNELGLLRALSICLCSVLRPPCVGGVGAAAES